LAAGGAPAREHALRRLPAARRAGLGPVRGPRLRPAGRHQAARAAGAFSPVGHARAGEGSRRPRRGRRFGRAPTIEAALRPLNPTWRLIGALSVAVVIFYYGSTS